jgi:threonine/homoserine/homoserine lactone efflux protein
MDAGMILLMLKGIVIGLSIAAPVGPIGLLCIQRTLSKGRLSGFISGLGAATADMVYGIIATLGLTVVSNFLVGQQSWLKTAGGLFLIYLGIRIFASRNVQQQEIQENVKENKLLKDYLSTLFLTMTNPVTILAFLAIFTSLDVLGGQNSHFAALAVVAGVFTGSLLWWLVLSCFTGLFRNRVNLKYVNIASALIIIGFGAAALIH